MKTVLLHTCCAPCSTAVIESFLKSGEALVTVFFYNPNIHPVSEYLRRKAELKAYLVSINIPSIDLDSDTAWDNQATQWFETVKGVEWVSEKSRIRCERCIHVRLEITALKAKQEGFESFSTTLTVSPHKDADQINRIGRHVSDVMGVHFIEADHKQDGGFQRSVEQSHKSNMVRQNYCGCVFSRLERKRYVKIKA